MRLLIPLVVLFSTTAGATAAETRDYAQVRLIFQKHCLACHDAKQREGELVMETFAGLMKGGENGSPVVPGKADESPLVKQIERREKPYMPPKKAKDTLSAEEISLIRAWIDAGATGPKAG